MLKYSKTRAFEILHRNMKAIKKTKIKPFRGENRNVWDEKYTEEE